jgi:hypothetical protein
MPSVVARIGVGRLALLAVVVLAGLIASTFLAGGKSVRQQDRAHHVVDLGASSGPAPPPSATASAGQVDSEIALAHAESRSAVHHRLAPGRAKNAASVTDRVAPGAPTDAQIKRELRQNGAGLGSKAAVLADGTALAPFNAPAVVQAVIAGGNQIFNFPYIWGGGHGSFIDKGYDCSGSVSYALWYAGLLNRPLVAADFMRWGKPGPGKWITIEASGGHVYMYVAGLRFDTSGRSGPRGSRWQRASRSNAGFVAVHPPGL